MRLSCGRNLYFVKQCRDLQSCEVPSLAVAVPDLERIAHHAHRGKVATVAIHDLISHRFARAFQ